MEYISQSAAKILKICNTTDIYFKLFQVNCLRKFRYNW